MVVLLIKIGKSERKKDRFRKIKISVFGMSNLRCPSNFLEVMFDNYLLLYCEVLKGIFSIFVSPEPHLWLLQLNSQKVPVMQLL